MNSEQVADLAAEHRHRKFMVINNKKRFIEVFKCSGEDMNLVLTTGLPPAPINAPAPHNLITPALPPVTALNGSVLANGVANGLGLALPVSLTNTSLGFAPLASASAPSLGMMNKPILAQGLCRHHFS